MRNLLMEWGQPECPPSSLSSRGEVLLEKTSSLWRDGFPQGEEFPTVEAKGGSGNEDVHPRRREEVSRWRDVRRGVRDGLHHPRMEGPEGPRPGERDPL